MHHLSILLPDGSTVAAILDAPAAPRACFVMAHGAGAGMTHPFMADVAAGLHDRGIATLRYQFPFMEHGSKRPDRPPVAHAAICAAVDEAARRLPGVPLFAGGKSFGARMTSQTQAEQPLPGVRGLVFFGYPLHPAKQPATTRADHLARVAIPMLFLQGTNDALAEIGLLRDVLETLGPTAVLHELPGADHAFHVPKRSGRTDGEVRVSALDAAAAWMHG